MDVTSVVSEEAGAAEIVISRVINFFILEARLHQKT